jgi:hypothetical protein
MAQNEQLGCGCKVYQKKLGSTTWNRIDMCSVHYEAKALYDALESLTRWLRAHAEHTDESYVQSMAQAVSALERVRIA